MTDVTRRPAPHPATPGCTDRSSQGICPCGWTPPCRDGCSQAVVIAGGRFCPYCGSDQGQLLVTHPGSSAPTCRVTASVGSEATVCSCGWRHPDQASLEWALWVAGSTLTG